jgi:hypothetical protein
MAEFPKPTKGITPAHFIVSADVERSRRFYADGMRYPDGHLIEVASRSERLPGGGHRESPPGL